MSPPPLPPEATISSHPFRRTLPSGAKIAAIYLIVGSLWIFFSDQWLQLLVKQPLHTLTHLQTIKGWLYVGVTAAMLYGLIDQEMRVSRLTTRTLKKTLSDLMATRQALLDSQEQFLAFMDYSPAAAWITDAQGRMEYISQTYRRMFQVPSRVIGQLVADLYPAPIAQTYLTNIQMVATTGQVLQTIEPGIRPDGSSGEFLVYKFPLPQPDGKVSIGGVALDVTEWKQAESALRASEERYRMVVETTLEGVWLIDTEGYTTYVNARMAQMLGYSVEEMLGKPLFSFMDEAARSLAEEALDRRRRGIEEQHDFRLKTRTGKDLWVLISTNPLHDKSGTYIGALAMITNITDRKRLENSLRHQAERLELTGAIAQRIRQSLNVNEILNTTVVEVKQWLQADRVMVYQFAADMSGTIVAESVNPGWSVALDCQIEDTCFQTGAGTAYQQGKTRAIANVYDAGLTDCHLQLLEQFEVKANLIAPIILISEDTHHLWGLLIAHQCTAPREWQPAQLEVLDQIAVQLAIGIQQGQTLEQAQRELKERQQAETYLRAALAEKEVLLKEIHHRVKNNLQIISGLLQLQAQSFDDPHIITALRESQSRIESMSLIHKKLYTSSDLGHIDVADYIHSLAVSLLTTYQIQPGRVALQVDVAPVILSLDQAIPCGLIINELVSNALKYAFPDNCSGEIVVQLWAVDQQIELTIGDNGIGLPEDLNWQNAQSLGLSLVYALATEQLDGSVTVVNEGGTTFTIKFPQSLPKK